MGSFLLEGKDMGEKAHCNLGWGKEAPHVGVEGWELFGKEIGSGCPKPVIAGLANQGSGDEN